ncbi:hypothetical protein RJ639_010809 [Escallonia herrerae]|uniref:Uncharacterized protein n=1 Tax=Escallonia herrerae TaxID=1293975 RepID=A0AA88VLC4_9ASTE|nr:hypothetical protein RJ639_010809 [Escallonia herrerae]
MLKLHYFRKFIKKVKFQTLKFSSYQVTDGEKQLWALIHSKGLLHKEVQDLYRKVRAGYENIILNHEVVELQNVEFCLWKLHYKHIDEYRRRIRQTGAKSETNKSETVQNNVDGHMEGFYSFLSEAIEFYKELVGKFRRRYRLVGEPLLYEKVASSCSVEAVRLHKRQFACHRFFVCLGDLARYRELCKKSQTTNCRWSVSATFYFEATRIYPDSGNAQNQLALLATYVGDDFLALYHCVRSLALKEPFPDAWDNLMLLLEKNRSSDLHSLSSKAHFDFLKPHGESFSETKSEANSVSSNNKELEATGPIFSGKTELWSLLVRMTSFFLIKSRYSSAADYTSIIKFYTNLNSDVLVWFFCVA